MREGDDETHLDGEEVIEVKHYDRHSRTYIHTYIQTYSPPSDLTYLRNQYQTNIFIYFWRYFRSGQGVSFISNPRIHTLVNVIDTLSARIYTTGGQQ